MSPYREMGERDQYKDDELTKRHRPFEFTVHLVVMIGSTWSLTIMLGIWLASAILSILVQIHHELYH